MAEWVPRTFECASFSNGNGDDGPVDGALSEPEPAFCDEPNPATDPRRLPAAAPHPHSLDRARRLLYVSRFVYYLSEMTWTFGSFLWLAALSDYASLFWISAYQLTGRILVIGLVPPLAARIDDGGGGDNGRYRLAAAWLVGQHVCVAATLLLVHGGLRQSAAAPAAARDGPSAVGAALICLGGAVSQALHAALEVAIERDWIVVMDEEVARCAPDEGERGPPGDGPESPWLRDTNVALRRIYLACQALGPLAVGLLVDGLGLTASLWVVLVGKGVSMLVVCGAMHWMCEWVPALRQRKNCKGHRSESHSGEDDDGNINRNTDDVPGRLCDGDTEESDDEAPPAIKGECGSGLCLYFSQSTLLLGAGVGLALLYTNVLTLGGIMVAYLDEKGNAAGQSYVASKIGIFKALSDVAGFVGTVHFSRSPLPLEAKGLRYLVGMVACLTVSMVGVALGGDLGAALVIAGVIPSRIGLWGYDLVALQLFQAHIEAPLRGAIGGAQTALNNGLEFVPYLLGMAFPAVGDFWRVMAVGYAGVWVALAAYLWGIRRRSHRPRPVFHPAPVVEMS